MRAVAVRWEGFGELGDFVVDEFLDGGGVGAALAFGGELELVEGFGEVVLGFEDHGEVIAGFGSVAVAPGGANPGIGFGNFVVAVEDPTVGIPGGDDQAGAAEGGGAGFAFVGGLIEEVEGAARGGFGEGKVEGVVGELVGGVVEQERVVAGGDDGFEEGFAFGGFLLVEKELA